MEIFEMKLDDIMRHGIFKISLVANPAMEANYVRLSEVLTLAKVDAEKQMIIGPAMIPDKLITRLDDEGKEYQIYFTADTIEQAAHLYLLQSKQHLTNIEHDADVQGVVTVESWIVDDPKQDKSATLGFDVPKGTWMIAMKVMNKEVWDKLIKSDMLKGFSIEGSFLPVLEPADEVQLFAQLSALIDSLKPE